MKELTIEEYNKIIAKHMELEKLSKKTVIDNKDIQYFGNARQLELIINKAKEKYVDPHFLAMRNSELEELGLYVFEGRLPDLIMPPPDFMKSDFKL